MVNHRLFMDTLPIAQHGQQIRTLLVEDDDELRHGLADYLRVHGIGVTDVASGIGFYQARREQRFDVAILDINLPDITGFALANELAAERRTGVIILTARTATADRIRGYAEGADLYLTKPVNGQELLLAIQNLAKRVTEAVDTGPEEPEIGPRWRLDRVQHRLIAPNEVEIPLTGREVMLLQFLADAGQGGTASRRFLASKLGYENLSAESRGLDALLRRLRMKASSVNCALPIRAIYARGISFSAPLDIM
ncbi:response regulator transcription factor [Sphingobium sp. B12D2B]|uniref:response regulator transcription factor n=1 Tax=Sphingobium sp. B12D2B TaxID=2940577 RepID=UPI0022242B5E|nr:response regulator transcription factor [Sphingobium sp. B12D2B]MCW2351813.1 two-component system torCAD operon response regulator TorR [Sphingobium sp. B12D2B]